MITPGDAEHFAEFICDDCAGQELRDTVQEVREAAAEHAYDHGCDPEPHDSGRDHA